MSIVSQPKFGTEKIVLLGNGMSGFDDAYPVELKGLIHPLDFKYLMYKFNAQIEVFKNNYINFQVTNVITIGICVVLLILSLLKVTDQWLNLEITAGIGALGVVGMFSYIIRGNKKMMQHIEEVTLELSDRYSDVGVSFSCEKKSKRRCCSHAIWVLTAASYDLVIQIKSKKGGVDIPSYVNNDISINMNSALIN